MTLLRSTQNCLPDIESLEVVVMRSWGFEHEPVHVVLHEDVSEFNRDASLVTLSAGGPVRLGDMPGQQIIGIVERHRPLLARDSSHNPPQVVRDAFERANVHLAADAVVVELVPSSGGVPIDRDTDTIEFAVGVASLLSVMVMFGSIMLAVLNARAARRQQAPGRRPAGRLAPRRPL